MALKIRSKFWRVVFDVTYWLYTKSPEGSIWEVWLLNKCQEITKKGRLIDDNR
jgi:hypothetical protein